MTTCSLSHSGIGIQVPELVRSARASRMSRPPAGSRSSTARRTRAGGASCTRPVAASSRSTRPRSPRPVQNASPAKAVRPSTSRAAGPGPPGRSACRSSSSSPARSGRAKNGSTGGSPCATIAPGQGRVLDEVDDRDRLVEGGAGVDVDQRVGHEPEPERGEPQGRPVDWPAQAPQGRAAAPAMPERAVRERRCRHARHLDQQAVEGGQEPDPEERRAEQTVSAREHAEAKYAGQVRPRCNPAGGRGRCRAASRRRRRTHPRGCRSSPGPVVVRTSGYHAGVNRSRSAPETGRCGPRSHPGSAP